MAFKLLSIIIPVYNVEKYLTECLVSILNQNDSDRIELICINDGSTDSSIEILKGIGKNYPILQVFDQRNIGLGATRNKGIGIARGKYLMFVDSDDWIEKASLKDLLDELSERDHDIIEFKTRIYNEIRGDYLPYNRFSKIMSEGISGTDYLNQQNQLLLTACSRIWSREFVISNGLQFAESKLFEDVEFSLLAYSLADKISNINSNIYNYRFREDSITNSYEREGYIVDFYKERLFNHIKYRKYFQDFHVKMLFNRAISRILIKSFIVIFSRKMIKIRNIKYLAISTLYSIIYFPFIIYFVILLSIRKVSNIKGNRSSNTFL